MCCLIAFFSSIFANFANVDNILGIFAHFGRHRNQFSNTKIIVDKQMQTVKHRHVSGPKFPSLAKSKDALNYSKQPSQLSDGKTYYPYTLLSDSEHEKFVKQNKWDKLEFDDCKVYDTRCITKLIFSCGKNDFLLDLTIDEAKCKIKDFFEAKISWLKNNIEGIGIMVVIEKDHESNKFEQIDIKKGLIEANHEIRVKIAVSQEQYTPHSLALFLFSFFGKTYKKLFAKSKKKRGNNLANKKKRCFFAINDNNSIVRD